MKKHSVVYDGSGSLSRFFQGLGAQVSRIVPAIRSYKFALAAFLLPFTVRAIPEIIAGPYPIGWDTIAFYVPTTVDWATGRVGLLQMIAMAPLMYSFSVAVYLASRVNPVWIFKIMGPLLYGSMI